MKYRVLISVGHFLVRISVRFFHTCAKTYLFFPEILQVLAKSVKSVIHEVDLTDPYQILGPYDLGILDSIFDVSCLLVKLELENLVVLNEQAG